MTGRRRPFTTTDLLELVNEKLTRAIATEVASGRSVTEQLPSPRVPQTVAEYAAADFPLNEEEQKIVRSFPGATPAVWVGMSLFVQQTLLQCYAEGSLSFEQIAALQKRIALGVPSYERILILGMMVEQALAITPAKRRERKFPDPLKTVACSMVDAVRLTRPDEKLQTVLGEAVSVIVAMGIFDKGQAPSAGTLRNWYTQDRRSSGKPISRGRPRSKP